MIKYYLRVIGWIWKNRDVKNCRQKWRRMERELARGDRHART
jgi:hypothetical protein